MGRHKVIDTVRLEKRTIVLFGGSAEKLKIGMTIRDEFGRGYKVSGVEMPIYLRIDNRPDSTGILIEGEFSSTEVII